MWESTCCQWPGIAGSILGSREPSSEATGRANVRVSGASGATRLPAAYGLREHVLAGGLLSYAADLASNYRSAARYVDRILKGAKPAELPVEQPTKYELMVNLKAARTLGITIPQSVLLRADEVIQ